MTMPVGDHGHGVALRVRGRDLPLGDGLVIYHN